MCSLLFLLVVVLNTTRSQARETIRGTITVLLSPVLVGFLGCCGNCHNQNHLRRGKGLSYLPSFASLLRDTKAQGQSWRWKTESRTTYSPWLLSQLSVYISGSPAQGRHCSQQVEPSYINQQFRKYATDVFSVQFHGNDSSVEVLSFPGILSEQARLYIMFAPCPFTSQNAPMLNHNLSFFVPPNLMLILIWHYKTQSNF